METVEPNKTVIEFTGEIVRLDVAHARESHYAEQGIRYVMFKCDEEFVSQHLEERFMHSFSGYRCFA
jgi:hypothetical protein